MYGLGSYTEITCCRDEARGRPTVSLTQVYECRAFLIRRQFVKLQDYRVGTHAMHDIEIERQLRIV